jgi:Prenyltransferase and squalene oxidase repeat
MPRQLARADSDAGPRAEILSYLNILQNPDGGWGFHAGEPSRVEPTGWVVRSLFDRAQAADGNNIRKAVHYLQSSQLPDGSWPACAEMNAGSWVTSLACSVLSACGDESAGNVATGLKWLCDDFPRDSSPWMRFIQRLRRQSHINSQNDSYRGWGWTPKTASWVEPTAFALLALGEARPERLPKNASERRDLAVALLYDRMCPGGGWNCGNPRVYGVDGDALVLPTCWALLALRDAVEKPGRALSLAWLQKEFAKIESAASLAVARMTLENYGVVSPQAKRELQGYSVEELAEQGTHVLAWVSMALDPARQWAAPAGATKKTATGNTQ